jgi:hypothetical protein
MHALENSIIFALIELIRYVLFGDGLFLYPMTQVCIILRSILLNSSSKVTIKDQSELDPRLPKNIPDIEIMPIAHDAFNFENPVSDKTKGVFSFLCVALQPQSFGSIRLASLDPRVRPACDLGFLSHAADYQPLRKAILLSRAIARRMREDGYIMQELRGPKSNSEADIDEYIGSTCNSTFHYSSTCRMAPEDDPQPGVVDDCLKVHGVPNLRIADCSVFPDILATHLQAPAVMVGERCAAFISATYKAERDECKLICNVNYMLSLIFHRN